jgi:NAD(P)-dependent dehydrogenase (short-subunit alcohol dehydrogenase family)
MATASPFDLSGMTALVTGGSKGLGAGCALALAEAGADLVLVARNTDALDDTAGRVSALGRRVSTASCDVTDVAALAKVINDGPKLDIFLNNAGTNIPEPFGDVTEDHFDQIMTINVRAAFFAAQAVAARMVRDTNGGSIIHMSSQMGHVGAVNRTVYCTSKHALEGLAKAMAVELAPQGIRVNTVAPTFIETPLTKPFFDDPAFKDSVLRQIPLGHLGQVEDVASAVVFLASPAARMVTGSCLKVDGGWTAH